MKSAATKFCIAFAGSNRIAAGDLLDVAIASASTGALLQLQSSGQWSDTYGIDGGDY